MGLICDKSSTRMNIQALFVPGLLFGVFLLSLIANSKGRKFALLVMMVTVTLAQLLLFASIYFKILWLLEIAQFLYGLGCSAGLTLNFIYAGELFNDSNRQLATVAYCAGW